MVGGATMVKGQRVVTPGGPGTIVYVRMQPPLYVIPAAVSVYLDRKRGKLGYTGTIYPAEKISVHECIEGCDGIHNPCDVRGCLSSGCFNVTLRGGYEINVCEYHSQRTDEEHRLKISPRRFPEYGSWTQDQVRKHGKEGE
jgi:hypothetical protein